MSLKLGTQFNDIEPRSERSITYFALSSEFTYEPRYSTHLIALLLVNFKATAKA